MTRLADFHAWKQAQVRRGNWPTPDEQRPACPVCRCLLAEHGPKGDAPCWEGRARMALARAPQDRDSLDLLAIERFPNPRSAIIGTAA